MGSEEPVRRVIEWDEFDELISSIASQIPDEDSPHAIVGLTRGGLVPAVRLSHMYNAKLFCLNISLRDDMVDDSEFDWDLLEDYRRVLIVDDINDSGKTFTTVLEKCYQKLVPGAKFCALLEKPTSKFKCAYSGEVINKGQEKDWIVFPWE